MRIAHFIQRYPPALGGSEAYFARLSEHCVRKGHEVTVFTTCANALEAFWDRRARTLEAGTTDENGVTVRRYPLLRCPGRRYLLKAASFLPHRLWQCMTVPCNPICPAMWRDVTRGIRSTSSRGLIERCSFDVVHASAFPYAWPIACGLRLARRLRVPFFLTPFLHLGDPADPDDRTRRGYLAPPFRWLLRQADGIFVQTPSERDAVLGLGVPPERVQLQGLGVDPDECTGGDRDGARESWRVRPDAMVVGHLANNSREKGTVDLLLAVERLWQRGMPIHVVLAGPEMPNFRSFWDEFTMRHPNCPVLRLGPLTDAQKRDFFASIDVFALPSRSDSFGLVLLEAWANGVPNVAYRAGGIADVIRDASDGRLVPCGDVEQLAVAIAELYGDARLRRRLGAAGAARLPADFCWSDTLGVVTERYARMAREHELVVHRTETARS